MRECASLAEVYSEGDLLAASDELQRIVTNDAMRLADPDRYRKAVADQLDYLSNIVRELNRNA